MSAGSRWPQAVDAGARGYSTPQRVANYPHGLGQLLTAGIEQRHGLVVTLPLFDALLGLLKRVLRRSFHLLFRSLTNPLDVFAEGL